MRLYVYSSGSIAAQKLIIGHTARSELTPLFSGYFDTTTDPNMLRALVGYCREMAEYQIFGIWYAFLCH